MSLTVTQTFRNWLVNKSTITALVTAGNIKVGWDRLPSDFPCILITQSSGRDLGYLGYGTAAAGSKIRQEDVTMQVDIFSKTSRKETLDISDVVVPVLISGGCTKESDVETYDDVLEAYRKIQLYSLYKFHDD